MSLAPDTLNLPVGGTARNGLSDSDLLGLYEQMLLIRRAEERLGKLFEEGELPAGVHLYIGQEACAVGICAHLDDRDWITSTHRGHGHFLAKGGGLDAMVAEIFGRETGICGGMGGTMHVADVSKGILGANGIVAGGIGIATGAAFAASLEGQGRVAVCFLGDGACNQGVFMEALNLSSLWKLPLVLVCENNGWSEFTPTSRGTSGAISDRAAPFGIPAETADGNDVEAVYAAAGRAVARARTGEGPTLLEFSTYRTRGHVEAEKFFLSSAYRSEDEVATWIARDPLSACAAILERRGVASATLEELDQQILSRIDNAVSKAREAPFPPPEALDGLMLTPPSGGL